MEQLKVMFYVRLAGFVRLLSITRNLIYIQMKVKCRKTRSRWMSAGAAYECTKDGNEILSEIQLPTACNEYEYVDELRKNKNKTATATQRTRFNDVLGLFFFVTSYLSGLDGLKLPAPHFYSERQLYTQNYKERIFSSLRNTSVKYNPAASGNPFTTEY
ncbi:hypothetical protein BaRGS_00023932 [Batillaria attramentaria]|uniref:Uncharacterized protein n=1 Tax=Batillaria attramentaria TaxID=370345 RepID=A0ABD0KCQ9_9CAEN